MKKFFKTIKYLSEYFVVIMVIKILGMLGLGRSVNICRFLAKKIGPLLPVHNIAKKNIQIIFGSKDSTQVVIDKKIFDIDILLKQIWDNFGRFIGEFPYVYNKPKDFFNIELIGYDIVKPFIESKQPYILFTGHFANWEIAFKILPILYPNFAVIYRKANNPYINKLINRFRGEENIKLIPKGERGAKLLISAIKEGCAIVALVDQKMNNGLEMPFLGHRAMTAYAIAKIAFHYNYPIIPAQIVRKKNGNIKVIIHPPLKVEKTCNNEKNYYNVMTVVNQILEKWIKKHPDQWFWFHNRWKNFK